VVNTRLCFKQNLFARGVVVVVVGMVVVAIDESNRLIGDCSCEQYTH
jgi:hypothetical protein